MPTTTPHPLAPEIGDTVSGMTVSASESRLDRQRLRVVGLGLLAGLVCIAALVAGALAFPEAGGHLAYLGALFLAGFWRARAAPDAALLSVGLIWIVQPAALLGGLLLTGELPDAPGSAGGRVTLALGTALLVLLLPVPGLGAWLGKVVAERRQGRGGTDQG